MNEIYVPAFHPRSSAFVADHFQKWIRRLPEGKEILFFCIGTIRISGDSLGPYTGFQLKKCLELLNKRKIHVAGTPEHPIHALNLEEEYLRLTAKYPCASIVAIDASLGRREQMGMLSLREGGLFPGIALNKSLPFVGDYCITGVVGISGPDGMGHLKETPFCLVYEMAQRIAEGILLSFAEAEFHPTQ